MSSIHYSFTYVEAQRTECLGKLVQPWKEGWVVAGEIWSTAWHSICVCTGWFSFCEECCACAQLPKTSHNTVCHCRETFNKEAILSSTNRFKEKGTWYLTFKNYIQEFSMCRINLYLDFFLTSRKVWKKPEKSLPTATGLAHKCMRMV